MPRPRTASRDLYHPTPEEMTLQGLLEALADPVRRDIAWQLFHADGEKNCGTFGLSVSRSTSTHHFNVLREAGVIRQYYQGTQKMNSLRAQELEERFPGLLRALIAACDREEPATTV